MGLERSKPITCFFPRLSKQPSSLRQLPESSCELCTLSLHLRNLPPLIQRTWTNMRPPRSRRGQVRTTSTFLLMRMLTERDLGHKRRLLQKLGFAFFLFGLFNNGELLQIQNLQISWHVYAVLYVIILSAALDLVPPSTPKGIIAFCNIAPALVAKVGWPYFLKGKIRYTKRLIGCCVMSFLGMIVSRRAMSSRIKLTHLTLFLS